MREINWNEVVYIYWNYFGGCVIGVWAILTRMAQ